MASLAQLIRQSLREEPDVWKLDHYHARHSSGLELWVANGWPFLHVEASPRWGEVRFGTIAKLTLMGEVRRLNARRARAALAAGMARQVAGDKSRDEP